MSDPSDDFFHRCSSTQKTHTFSGPSLLHQIRLCFPSSEPHSSTLEALQVSALPSDRP